MESPDYVRLSTAADISLGFSNGAFYRDVELYCINLLLYYPEGCRANCLYCGQARTSAQAAICKSLIRVEWPLRRLNDVIDRFKRFLENGSFLRAYRVCVASITHAKAVKGEIEVVKKVSSELNVPVSALISPTIFTKQYMEELRSAGAERIGIAIDCATPQLFTLLRGKEAKGPHRWESYLNGVEEAVEVMGRGKVGIHLIVGLGESEEEAVALMQRVKRLGVETHLFSFYPEKGTILEDWPRPHIGQYRRVQLARYIIDNCLASYEDMEFNEYGQITSYGVDVNRVAASGKPFMTSGCPGCNRPFSNERPGETLRNYPYHPSRREALRALKQAKRYATPKNTFQYLVSYLKLKGL